MAAPTALELKSVHAMMVSHSARSAGFCENQKLQEIFFVRVGCCSIMVDFHKITSVRSFESSAVSFQPRHQAHHKLARRFVFVARLATWCESSLQE